MSNMDAIHTVAGRSRGPDGFVTHAPPPSRCPCIDETGSRRNKCDAVKCYMQTEECFCRREHRAEKLLAQGVDVAKLAPTWAPKPPADTEVKPHPPGQPEKRWTTERIEELLVLDAQGLSDAQIGERLGRTKNAIQQQLSKLRRRRTH